jgi:recombination protein RecT
MKTVLRNMLGKWGILSIEMQKAITEDESEIKDITEESNEEEQNNVIDAEFSEADENTSKETAQSAMDIDFDSK